MKANHLKSLTKLLIQSLDSAEILKTKPEIYKLDKQKANNDGTFRVYSVYDYGISYQVTEEVIYILRVRHNAQKLKKHSWKL